MTCEIMTKQILWYVILVIAMYFFHDVLVCVYVCKSMRVSAECVSRKQLSRPYQWARLTYGEL